MLFRNENPVLGPQTQLDDSATIINSGLLNLTPKILTREYISTELAASSVASFFWVAPYACQIVAVKEVHSVVGGLAAAVRPRKITADAVAPGAAAGATVVELTTAVFDLTLSVNTVRAGTLSATVSDLKLAVGDRLAYNPSGTLTGLIGYLQIELIRL